LVENKSKKEYVKKVPSSILEEIFQETFSELEQGDTFDKPTVSKLRELSQSGSFKDKNKLISILKGDLCENTQTQN
jgi:hypothetical protein